GGGGGGGRVAEGERDHCGDRSGSLVDGSGHIVTRPCSRMCRLHAGDARRPQPSTRIAEEISDLVGVGRRAVSPINVVVKRRQTATRASSLSFGRAGAICG